VTFAMRDVRLAARSLARSRTFVATAVLSLGLAIALNTTIYSLLDAMIDPDVGVRQPQQIYRLRYYGDAHHRLPPNAVERALASGLPGYGGVTGYRVYNPVYPTLVERGDVFRNVRPMVVRADFFSVLGVRPSHGRVFSPVDAGSSMAVISDALADQLFPNGQSAVGQRIDVDARPYDVVGIARRSAAFPAMNTDVWLLDEGAGLARVPISLVRLSDGVTPELVAPRLQLLAARLAGEAFEPPSETRFYLSGSAQPQFHASGFHYALIAAVVAILFVACGNLATLQLARGLTRNPELALRVALGATRSQIVATLLAESALLAGAGLVTGLLMMFWGVHALRSAIPPEIADYIVEPRVSWHLVAAAATVTVVSLVLAGLLPALKLARVDANSLLRKSSGTGSHRTHRRWYGAMIVAQIGFALPVLTGAVLIMRSVSRINDPDFEISHFGYDPRPIVGATIPVQRAAAGSVYLADLAERLTARAHTVRNVVDAAVSFSVAPMNATVSFENADGASRDILVPAWTYTAVSPSYFHTLGRDMARGADFSAGVHAAATTVIDEPTAKFMWPGVDPIGRLIKFGDGRSPAPWMRVSGVVRDLRDPELVQNMYWMSGHRLGDVYRVLTAGDSLGAADRTQAATLMVRASSAPQRVAVDLRHALATAGSRGALTVSTMEDSRGLPVMRTRERFVSTIFTIFAIIAVGLAAVGTYGIVSHSVNDRRREFGVRISLGATPRNILRDVLREGAVLALAGVALGLVLTQQSLHWIIYFMIDWNDTSNSPLFAAIAGSLCVSIFVAALVPALRATRVDPVEALRNE
jgi:predicted permease